MRVLIFGASITQGFWDTEGGWAARLRKYYDQRQVQNLQANDEPIIFNLGISGDTTAGVIGRLANEIKARQSGEELSIVLSVGINDTVYRNQEFESTPEKYESQLGKILEISKDYSSKIMFVGLTPCVDARVQPFPWSSSGKCYSNERIWLFEETLRQFSKHHAILHVPVFDKLQTAQAQHELMPDGIHPNNQGHQLIFEIVRPELDKLLGQRPC